MGRGRPSAGWCVTIAALALFGCSATHRAVLQAPNPGRLPPFLVAAPVHVVNAQTAAADVVRALLSTDVAMNYQQYTESVIAIVRAELDKRRTAGSNGQEKRIGVSIVDVRIIPSPTMRCLVNFTVETGDGYVRGHETAGASWNYHSAVDAALSNVVLAILNDEQVITYLEN